MSDNRPIVYQEGADRWVFRASSIGLPARCLTAAALGYDPLPAPEYLVKAAEAGSRYEGIVKSRLRTDGWKITGEQGSVDVEVTDRLIVRGHLDGWHIYPPEVGDETPGARGFEWRTIVPAGSDLMLEVKSMSGRVFDRWLTQGFAGFPAYGWQLGVYMRATGRPALYVVVNRDDDSELLFQYVAEPPVGWGEIRSKVMMVDYWRREGRLPDCEGHTYTCPYDYLCDSKEMQFEELEDGSADTIRRLAAEYDEQRRLLADVKARQDTVKDELKVALGGREAVEVDGWAVRVQQVTKRSQDKKALADFLLGQGRRLDEFMRESEYERLTVTVSSTGEEGAI